MHKRQEASANTAGSGLENPLPVPPDSLHDDVEDAEHISDVNALLSEAMLPENPLDNLETSGEPILEELQSYHLSETK